MLDRLPPELLADILDLAAPLSLSKTGYKEYSKMLATCCKVSRGVRVVAQTMLWKVVRVEGKDKVDKLAQAVKEDNAAKLVRTLMVNNVKPQCLSQAVDLVASCPNLERLFLLAGGLQSLPSVLHTLSIPQLNHLSHLRQLSLVCLTIPSPPGAFPQLVELSLARITATHGTITSFLTHANLPSLQALTLSCIVDQSKGLTYFVPTLPPALVEQLGALQLPFDDVTCLAPNLQTHPLPKLLLLCRSNLLYLKNRRPPSFAHSLLIDEPYWFSKEASARSKKSVFREEAKDLNSLVTFLSTAADVQAVFLPLCLHPSSLPPSECAEALDRFLEACKAQNIDVRWRSEPFSAENSETFCIDFLEYAKELRAKSKQEAE